LGLALLVAYNLLTSAVSISKEIDNQYEDSHFLGNIPLVKQKIQTRQQSSITQRPVEQHEYPFEFAACLLTKDDKIILPEWLAYHYTVMPLRYLIVAVDPLSITSPEPILDMYRNYTNLKIETWTGNWYWKMTHWNNSQLSMLPPKTDKLIITVKRQRQRSFYSLCLQRLNKLNHTWTALIDTDEYFTYNSVMSAELKGGEKIRDAVLAAEHRRQLPAPIGKQNETIAHWIHQHGAEQAGLTNKTLCAVYPRLQFFSKYVQNISDPFGLPTKHNVSFDREAFHTLQYTAHDKLKGSFQGPLVLPSKALINAALMKAEYKVRNVHVPFQTWMCDGDAQVEVTEGWPFRVHQYSGSLKTFLSRPERSVQMWEQRNQNKFVDNYDLSLTRWFPGFIKLLQRDESDDGVELAYRLTQQAHDDAYDESMTIKYRITVLNETVSPIYEWDPPLTDNKKAARLWQGLTRPNGTNFTNS
jgi:hypothetical protein